MGFTFRIVKNDLPAIIAEFDSKTERAVKIVADDITQAIKATSPVDTGAMRDGYYDAVTSPTSAEVRSGDDLEYPLYVEMGHHTRSGSFVPAQPHFVPAFDAAQATGAFVNAAKEAGLFSK